LLAVQRPLADDSLWPKVPVRGLRRQLTFVGRAHASKVNFLARPRIHTAGHKRSVDATPGSRRSRRKALNPIALSVDKSK